ncbi:hypothetical protein [Neobacillus fumarioli]|uniref:hypothetical protein n=1 Tax=Neobacillus fumarioli TaxID=105229 RepID=UPI000832AD9E|nr:hypothetical protein [Neobacillus fumarioli]
MKYNGNGICIQTISGGIVNFGGALKIAPISITKTTTSSLPSTSGSSSIPLSISSSISGPLGG